MRNFGKNFLISFAFFLSAILLAADIFVLVQEEYLLIVGGTLAKITSWFDSTFAKGYELIYGKVVCYGYFCLIPSSFFFAYRYTREEAGKRWKAFLSLYIILSVAAAGLFYGMVWKDLAALPRNPVEDSFYFILHFVPLPASFANIMLNLAYIWVYYLFPFIGVAALLTISLVAKKLDWDHPIGALFGVLFLLDVLGALITAYSIILGVTVAVIITIVWAVRGFFHVDPNTVVHTSGGDLTQVDGDLYKDSNGNYYRDDGSGGFHSA